MNLKWINQAPEEAAQKNTNNINIRQHREQWGISLGCMHAAIVSRAGELIPLIYLRRVNSVPKPVSVSR